MGRDKIFSYNGRKHESSPLLQLKEFICTCALLTTACRQVKQSLLQREQRYFCPYVTGVSDGRESACKAGDPGSIPGSGKSPEWGKATHSSILDWRIPRTEEPGGLQAMGSQRVRHDLATK